MMPDIGAWIKNKRRVCCIMKKLFVLLCTVALLSFAGMAFAADAGHVAPDYDPVAPAVVVDGASGDVVIVPVPAAAAVAVADHLPAGVTVGNVFVLTFEPAKPGTTGDIAMAAASADKDKNYNCVYIEDNAKPKGAVDAATTFTAYPFQNGKAIGVKYDNHPFKTGAAVAKTTVPTSSSSGCNAGFAGLLVLAALPLVYFRKK